MDLSLNDIVRIVVVCLIGGASIVAAGFAWDQRAIIGALLDAARRRYLTVSFAGLVEAIADDRSDDARNVHSDALDRPWNDAVPEMPERTEWTREELVTFLAGIRAIGADGVAAPIAKAKISAAAGLRAEDAAELIRAARGEPEPAPDPRSVLRVRDGQGERVIAR